MDNNPADTHRRKLLTGAVTLAVTSPLMTSLSARAAASEQPTQAASQPTAGANLSARRKLGALEVSSIGLGVQESSCRRRE